MSELITRWPIWYLGVVGYCLYLAAITASDAMKLTLADDGPASSMAHPGAYAAGFRTARMFRALLWGAGGLGLVFGVPWVRLLLLGAFVWPMRRLYNDIAIGFAEGRRASALAAAPEYVRGRVKPLPFDRFVAGVAVAVLRGAPAVALAYAYIFWGR